MNNFVKRTALFVKSEWIMAEITFSLKKITVVLALILEQSI